MQDPGGGERSGGGCGWFAGAMGTGRCGGHRRVGALPAEHPLRSCPGVLLTSHVAWFSDRSVPTLQKMAGEEVLRGLRGEPLKNQVNR